MTDRDLNRKRISSYLDLLDLEIFNKILLEREKILSSIDEQSFKKHIIYQITI